MTALKIRSMNFKILREQQGIHLHNMIEEFIHIVSLVSSSYLIVSIKTESRCRSSIIQRQH